MTTPDTDLAALARVCHLCDRRAPLLDVECHPTKDTYLLRFFCRPCGWLHRETASMPEAFLLMRDRMREMVIELGEADA